MGDVVAVSLRMDQGGNSSVVAISAVSAQSAAFNGGTPLLITPALDCFVRAGSNPTALANGTDIFLTGGASYRVVLPQITSVKLAFITTGGTGNVYLTPGA